MPDPEKGFNEETEMESGNAQPSMSNKKSEAAEDTPIDPQGEMDNDILDALRRMAISLEEITTKSRGPDREGNSQQGEEQAAKNTGSSSVSIYRVQSSTDLNHLRFPEGHSVRVLTRANQQDFYLITGKTRVDVDDMVELLKGEDFSDGRGEGNQNNGLIWGLGGMLVGMAGAFTGLAFAP